MMKLIKDYFYDPRKIIPCIPYWLDKRINNFFNDPRWDSEPHTLLGISILKIIIIAFAIKGLLLSLSL